jgi:hypothetical protein
MLSKVHAQAAGSLTPKALLAIKPIQQFESPQTMDWSLTFWCYLRAPMLMWNMSDRAWARLDQRKYKLSPLYVSSQYWYGQMGGFLPHV